MFVTSADQRAGLLVAVITGGRPELKDRPTHKFLDELRAAGFTNITWVVAEHHADDYERDDHDMSVYPSQWAADYARRHWMSVDPCPPAGGFHGAFPGREWACLEAERRGCWGVLQLDDNIKALTFLQTRSAGYNIIRENGGMALFADLLAGVTLSTNGRMVGAQLMSLPRVQLEVARPGFPYSCFIEQVGDGREPWNGPFEDDITHAFQYGTRADGATAAVLPMLLYGKEHASNTGMRKKYNHKRSVQLQRLFPESARIGIRKAKSDGRYNPRIFHTMLPNAIRNPLAVTDRGLYNQVVERLNGMLSEWSESNIKHNRAKVEERIVADRAKVEDATND